jgi:hypothetical protein
MAKGLRKLCSVFNKKWTEKMQQSEAFKDLKISNLEGRLRQAEETNVAL